MVMKNICYIEFIHKRNVAFYYYFKLEINHENVVLKEDLHYIADNILLTKRVTS